MKKAPNQDQSKFSRKQFLTRCAGGAATLWCGAQMGAGPRGAEAALGVEPVAPRAKYLLLDSRLVERTENVTLRVGRVQKHPANPLFQEDKPWEVRFDNVYPNVLYDREQQIYKCWYSPFIVDELTRQTPAEQRAQVRYRATPTREMGVCYAVSRDGIHWEKPELGIIEFDGSKANNLVMRATHGDGIFKDEREKDPARRYKMFGGQQIPGRPRVFQAAFSSDGIHWSAPVLCPEVGVEGDTHNNAFWSPALGRYVGITRLFAGQRLVVRTESCDFTHWTRAVEILRGDPTNQTYAMATFAYAGVHLGLVMVFNVPSDRVHCELAWSPDTLTWHRIDAGTPLIPNSEKPGDYDWGCVYAAVTPVIMQDEIRCYYGASHGRHTDWRNGFLALATLRPDRFAGWEAGGVQGFLLTKPFALGRPRLLLNVEAEKGEALVEVLDEQGRGIPGYTAEDSVPLRLVDAIQAQTRWKNHQDLTPLRGEKVRFKIILRRAKLYALQFEPSAEQLP